MPHYQGMSAWHPVGLSELEEAAWGVILSDEHSLVTAGPGAGKTELLAQRACYLLQTRIVRPPKKILAISFKRDAAKNLKDRVAERCEAEDSIRFDSFTFDSFAKGLLDRFYLGLTREWRPSVNYEIMFPNFRTFPDYLDSLGINPVRSFERDSVLGSALPLVEDTQDRIAMAAIEWWRNCLHGRPNSRLTFPMIGRLVEFLIRLNPKLRAALRITYPYVFLDEFQDTTHVQYDLVKTIFGLSNSIITAVGDSKQKIMRWAMALDDSFGAFQEDFDGKQIYLNFNYRSSPELIRIQHKIALSLDAHVTPVESKTEPNITGRACEILEFATPEQESQYLATMVKEATLAGTLSPHDFAILVRQRTDRYLGEMEDTFRANGIELRDEGVLQDLLAEPLVTDLIKFLRLGRVHTTQGIKDEC